MFDIVVFSIVRDLRILKPNLRDPSYVLTSEMEAELVHFLQLREEYRTTFQVVIPWD